MMCNMVHSQKNLDSYVVTVGTLSHVPYGTALSALSAPQMRWTKISPELEGCKAGSLGKLL